jgi:hypothetical protein
MKRLIKNILPCFLSLAIWSVNDCVAQSLEDYNLVGKVKSVREYHYKTLDDCDYCEDLQKDSITLEFNSNGKIVKETEWNNSPFVRGSHKEVTTYKYNGNGKIVEERKEGYDGGVETTKYIRDAQGYIIREEEHIKSLNTNDIMISVEYRKNYSDGTAKEVSHYRCVGTDKILEYRNFCDENENITKSIDYKENNKISEVTYSKECEFYSTGKVAKDKKFINIGGVKRITASREFYSTGIAAKKTEFFNDGRVQKIKTWDEKGLKTSETCYMIDGNDNHKLDWKATYTYTYDSYGNWITQKITTVSNLIKIFPTDDGQRTDIDIYKRKITYYK